MNFEPSGERCPLCRGDSLVSRIVIAHDTRAPLDMTVLQCASCEFAWQWPLFRDEDESIEYMKERYETAEEGSYFDKTRRRKISALELEFVNSLVAERGTLLDVGSGDGTFAKVAFEDGWTSCGLDPAGPEEEETADSRRLRLFSGTLSDLGDDARFDVITMWDVVEHLERPLDLIVGCKNRLVPGGWLVLETGNFQSRARVLGGKNWYLYVTDHRWYFTPSTLHEVLKLSGFSQFRLCKQILRPWAVDIGIYKGPSMRSYFFSSCKRPWKVLRNINEFKQLTTLSSTYPDTAHLSLFTLAAQVTT